MFPKSCKIILTEVYYCFSQLFPVFPFSKGMMTPAPFPVISFCVGFTLVIFGFPDSRVRFRGYLVCLQQSADMLLM